MTLRLDRTGGANGASVAWEPERQKYYAAMAGNKTYPMSVYNANGKIVSGNSLETKFDVRGLWYNPGTKTIQANGYKDFGLGEYVLDENSMPESVKKMALASGQPNDQSVGAYDAGNNVIYFYDNEAVAMVREDMSGAKSTMPLYLGVSKKSKIKDNKNPENKANYSENASIYTGVRHAGIGLLNIKERQIELYNPDNGLLKMVLKLPEDAPVEISLNFSYCNGIYWLFDKKRREWRGYQ
jgi:hypothetical protein